MLKKRTIQIQGSMVKLQNSESQKSINDELSLILDIQELDMQMLQLMRLKRERKRELENINGIKSDLSVQIKTKDNDVLELKTLIKIGEEELKETQERIKELENKQSAVKKVDEFNALSHEMAQTDKQRVLKEQHLSDLMDKLAQEEEVLVNIKETLTSTVESSKVLEAEIHTRLEEINKEGALIKKKRDDLVQEAAPDVFAIYERLLTNKKDRVVVAIENRTCSGCHIQLTAQDENLVRKAERLIFCEHCSRILFWPQTEEVDQTSTTPTKGRRRRSRQAT